MSKLIYPLILFVWLADLMPAGAQSNPPVVTTTNVVVITNIVTITNYITNYVISTNFLKPTNLVAGTNLIKATNAVAAGPTVPTNFGPLLSKWQASVTLGMTITRGNSDTLLVSASAAGEKKWGASTNNDLTVSADALYGESKLPSGGPSQETAERAHSLIGYSRMFDDRFYGYIRWDALHDGISDIDYRMTLAPGAGYYFVKNKQMDFSTELGPGWIVQKLGAASPTDYTTVRVAEKLHYTISPHAKLWESAEFLPEVDDLENYIVNAELGVEASLTKNNHVAVRTVLNDQYNNVPAAGRLKNDLKLITSIVYKF